MIGFSPPPAVKPFKPFATEREDNLFNFDNLDSEVSTVDTEPDFEVYIPSLVRINVYDLHSSMKSLNNFLEGSFAGGLYHVGVEVYGTEFMYTSCEKHVQISPNVRPPHLHDFEEGRSSSSNSGIVQHTPRAHKFHSFKRSIDMGQTAFPRRRVLELAKDLGRNFQTETYHLIHKNCITFANEFTIALGVGPIPPIFLGPFGLKKESRASIADSQACSAVSKRRTDVNDLHNQVRDVVSPNNLHSQFDDVVSMCKRAVETFFVQETTVSHTCAI
jgi:hypothetical protein